MTTMRSEYLKMMSMSCSITTAVILCDRTIEVIRADGRREHHAVPPHVFRFALRDRAGVQADTAAAEQPLAAHGDLAPHQDFPISAFEDGFDGRGVLTRPDEVARGAVSEQQTDGLNEN